MAFDTARDDDYTQPFYFGTHLVPNGSPYPPLLELRPYQIPSTQEDTGNASMPQPYPMSGFGEPACTFQANSFNSPYTDQQSFPGPGLLPTSTNPPTSFAPSTYYTSRNSSLAYLAQSPYWPMEGMTSMDYHPGVPTQMPELGYESASPNSDGVPCSASTLPISPILNTDQGTMPLSTVNAAADLDEDSENADPCYAELLRKCLLQAPEHTMSLRDLYDWVALHSPKAKDPGSTGWKNSVRHNLSMNQGFEKVIDQDAPPSGQGGKSRSFWRLTEDAALRGIQSTTRYRKGDGKRKSQRNNRHGTPDDKRVKSGAKGGQATRRLANRRAAAAARSTWKPSPQEAYRDEPHATSYIGPPVVPNSYPTMTAFSEAANSIYWPGMTTAQDAAPLIAPSFFKAGSGTQPFYLPVSPDYSQPLDW